jgi:non-heme chloroperoxidase
LLSWASLAASGRAAAEQPTVAQVGPIQSEFDSLGAPVQSLTLANGRTVHYIDTGEAGWRPVLFVGGTGTSARAFEMTEFLQTLRRQLKLRVVSVERNGFGDTPITPGWSYGDYADEVRAVLDHLAVTRFAGLAISGGGPYLASRGFQIGPTTRARAPSSYAARWAIRRRRPPRSSATAARSPTSPPSRRQPSSIREPPTPW